MTFSNCINFILVLNVFSYSSTNAYLAEIFQSNKIVPDVLTNAPKNKTEVTYTSGVKADLGNELTPTQVKDSPKVEWDASPDTFFTLCLVDPDAPSRKEPTNREFLHWLVTNIPGSDINKGDVLAEYVGSAPPPSTGLHRYVFLVYKQPSKLKFDETSITNNSFKGREKFSIQRFAQKNNLGYPIGGYSK
ncbi:protein D3-like isoform X2 [Daktulosphaira vitifoliae]|uniref:protein D3-like isoform X2 n=1 Tax=Daktulosphaira vitifoliae TaxID=58002 RepID=UPI0021AAF3E3|nr:protein D3-like isoform X2 [Daktulosphaira vitifoliae]